MPVRHRWVWLSGLITIVLIGAGTAWWLTTRHHHSDCQTVRAIIDYNKSEEQLLTNTFVASENNEPSLGDYWNWANHLHELAAKITAPGLADDAHNLANEADQLAGLVKQARADTSTPTDPAAPPPWAQSYAAHAKQFKSQLISLDKACPAQ